MDGGAEREEVRGGRRGIGPTAVLLATREEGRSDEIAVHETDVLPATERVIARVATVQRGAISHRQLLDAGLTHSAIGRRVASGQLHRVYQGVYLVGHRALAPLARESAALLAVGNDAVLSHESAALAWGTLTDYAGDIHITVVERKLHSRPGLIVHQPTMAPEVRRRHGLTVTSPAQTLLDLAATHSPHLEHVFVESHGRRLVHPPELARAIERRGRKPGVGVLRAVVAGNESGFTRSKAERKLRQLLRAARLPEPRTNAMVLGLMVDCVWPDHRLVVEFDGYGFHGHRRAFETDRRRDARLVAGGYRVIRVTWLQLTLEPYAVLAALAAALASREPH